MLLIGGFVGADGTYFGEKFTDRRRHKERKKQTEDDFGVTLRKMPQLFAEMKNDLESDDTSLVREFIIIAKGTHVSVRRQVFAYYFESHENLEEKVAFLVERNLITDVTDSNVSKYRFTDSFIESIKRARF